MVAACRDRLNASTVIVFHIVKSGFKRNVNNGRSLLHCAVRDGTGVIIKKLLSLVVLIDSRSSWGGVTSLMTGATHEAFNLPIEREANPYCETRKGRVCCTLLRLVEMTPLFRSCCLLELTLIQRTVMV